METFPIPIGPFRARPDFYNQAKCRGLIGVIDFYATETVGIERARSICVTCPVRVECLSWAVDHEDEGMWGGLDERQRRTLIRSLRGLSPADRQARLASASVTMPVGKRTARSTSSAPASRTAVAG